jgi:hypothetical protein
MRGYAPLIREYAQQSPELVKADDDLQFLPYSGCF